MPRNVFKLLFWYKRTENSFPVNPELFCNTFLALLCMHVSVSVCSCLFTIVFLKSHLTSGHWTTTRSCQTGEECLSGLQTLHHNFPSQTQAEQHFPAQERLPIFTRVFELSWSHLVFSFPCQRRKLVVFEVRGQADWESWPELQQSYTASTKDFKHLCVFVSKSVFKSKGDNAAQTWAKYLFTPTSGCISVLGREVWLAA